MPTMPMPTIPVPTVEQYLAAAGDPNLNAVEYLSGLLEEFQAVEGNGFESLDAAYFNCQKALNHAQAKELQKKLSAIASMKCCTQESK